MQGAGYSRVGSNNTKYYSSTRSFEARALNFTAGVQSMHNGQSQGETTEGFVLEGTLEEVLTEPAPL